MLGEINQNGDKKNRIPNRFPVFLRLLISRLLTRVVLNDKGFVDFCCKLRTLR